MENDVRHYYSWICISILLFAMLTGLGVFFGCNRVKSGKYVGTIISLVTVKYFQFDYQYIWTYKDTGVLYELGNNTVAVDSILEHKIPIIDYFSSHALSDVLTQILYYFIHKDTKGVYANPYAWVLIVAETLILFYIVSSLFDFDKAIVYVLLFPIY